MTTFQFATKRLHGSTQRRGSAALLILLLLTLAATVGVLAWYYLGQSDAAEGPEVLTTKVFRGPFEQIVLEQGQVESSGSVDIKCEVKGTAQGGTEIIWLIDEGTHVEKGQKLVQLKTSGLEKDLVQQQIVCNTSHALVVQADNTLQAAKIARTEYLEGTFRQEEQLILSEIFVAEENLRRAQLAFQSTERLAARGIVSSLQLEGDQFAVEKARNELDAAQTKLEVLRKYTKAKMLKQFDSDIATAEAKWDAEKESHKLELEKLEEIKEQIDKCTIVAPEDGQVVYANETNRYGGSEFVVEEGALVRENQIVIRLPDPTQMQVKATINESRISLVAPEMPVAIEFDAIRGKTIQGLVTKVNQYAEPSSFRSGNIKEYAAYIEIYDPPPEVRSGMNAEVRIYVQKLDDALQVPVQALYETKRHYFCLLVQGDRWETREIQVGSSNDSFMTIESGLEEGDEIVLNPRAYADRLDLPDLPDPETPEASNGSPDPSAKSPNDPPRGKPKAKPDSEKDQSTESNNATADEGPGGGPPSGFDPSQMFSMRDSDGDGTLSADELQAIPAEYRGRMMAADTDGDGAITRDEFMQGVARRAAGGGAGQ